MAEASIYTINTVQVLESKSYKLEGEFMTPASRGASSKQQEVLENAAM